MQSNEHKKTLGRFKDDFNGRVGSEMIGLNPEYYAIQNQHIETKNQKEYQKQ